MKNNLSIEEHLEKICDWFDAGCHVDDKAQIMIIEAQEALKNKGWISVNDYLPEPKENPDAFEKASGVSEKVLAIMGEMPIVGVYHKELEKWQFPNFHGDWKPTHWMKIPKL